MIPSYFKFLILSSTAALFVICEDFELKILHTNDVHAHVEQFNKHGGPCTGDTSKCFGGVARRHTVIEQIRNSTKNVILIDGGDQFSGTLWYSFYKGLEAVRFMNYTKYDAMAIGNHEFDDGPEGLIKFLKTANFTVLSSNMDVSKDPNWPTPDPIYKRSVVIERSGRKVGLIGFITPETKWLSRPGKNIEFMDEITSIQKEVDKLKNEGVNILIAVGHSGFQTDQKIAKNVKDLDVVVGGHTNTFLYNGPQPSVDKIQGPYPVVVTQADGSKCLVVQDFMYGKYLGNLDVVFDVNGVMKSWNGNPIMLNASYKQDENVLRMVEQMAVPIHEARNKSVGRTLVYLQGDKISCRIGECNLGNMIGDAMIRNTQQHPDNTKWASVSLALINSGGIRSGDIDKKLNESINLEEIYNILPFGNTADIIEIQGKYLLQAFEHGFSGLSVRAGRFLQVSGFKVKFDSSKPEKERLVEVLALCVDCRIPEYKKLEPEKIYKVITSSYLADGGDGHSSLTKSSKRHPGDDIVLDVVEYFKNESPVSPAVEGRIIDVSKVAKEKCNVSVTHAPNVMCLLICLLIYFSKSSNF